MKYRSKLIMDDIAATSKELEFLTKVLRQVATEMEKATGAESKFCRSQKDGCYL